MVPNGLIANLYGPVEGKRHDCALLRESRILEKMVHMHNADGVAMAVYGDPAYVMRDHIYCPFQGAYLTEEEKAFNSSMSKARICVEWGFGKVVQEFAFLDFKKNLKLQLQPVGKYYAVGVLLTNAHTCLYGSLTSRFFNIEPPSLESYFS